MASTIQDSGSRSFEEVALGGNDVTKSVDAVLAQAAQDAQSQGTSDLSGSYVYEDFSVTPDDLEKINNGQEGDLPDLLILDSSSSEAETIKKTSKVSKVLIITALVLGALIVIAGIAAAALIILGPSVGLSAFALPFALV